MPSFPTSPTGRLIGTVLARGIVPAWVLAGATMKLMERSPKLLPEQIWRNAAAEGINLYALLAVLIVLEFFAVGVMLFLGRLSRLMAGFMLVVFCGVLINELAHGASSCGCLGGFSPPPYLMLAIDGALLLGIVLFPTMRGSGGGSKPLLPGGALAATAAWTLGLGTVATILVMNENRTTVVYGEDEPAPGAGDGTTNGGSEAPGDDEVAGAPGDTASAEPPTGGAQPAVSRRPEPLPGFFAPMVDEWVGQRWDELRLARFMPRSKWPEGWETGRHYVILYSRTCDHCQELFHLWFYQAPPSPTTTYAIPESKSGFATEGLFEIECVGCRELELPVGCDWLMTPPVVLRLEDGVVECAREGEDVVDPACILFR